MQIRTLGTLALPESEIDNHPRLLLLLVYLAHHGETPRDHVARVFWPQASDARNSLSSALSRLRRLAPGAVVSTGKYVSTTVTTDAAQLLATHLPAPDVAALYTGVFLAPVDVSNDQIELGEWISETRHQVTDHIVKVTTRFHVDSNERRQLSSQLAADVNNAALATSDRHLIADFLRSESSSGTPFFGRESTLKELCVGVRSASLVCVYGLPGAGKSALLTEFMRRSEQFLPAMTIHKIDLDRESNPEAIDSAIEKVRSLFVRKPTRTGAILLDDITPSEEVIAKLGQVTDSGIAVIFVASAKPIYVKNGIFVSGLDNHDAKSLFLKQANSRDSSDLCDAPTLVEEICGQVGNNPRGIELLAAWSEVISLEQLTSLGDRPWLFSDRPTGATDTILDIIEPPIQALDARTLSVLASLSVVRGYFDSMTASVIADADLRDLENLCNCALLQRHSTDCFTIHPLVAASRTLMLGFGDRSEAQQTLDAYLLSLLAHRPNSSNDASPGHLLSRLQVHAQDVELAWKRAVDRRDWCWIDQAVGKFTILAGMSKSAVERMDAVQYCLQAMEKHGAPAGVRQRANRDYAVVSGTIPVPTESVRVAIARATSIGPAVDSDAYLGARRALARSLANEGQRGSAIAVLAEALKAAQTTSLSNDYLRARLDLAFLLTDQGKADAAIELLKPAIVDLTRSNDRRLLAQHLYCLARVQVGAAGTEALQTIRAAESNIEPSNFYSRQGLEVLRAYVHYFNRAYEQALAYFKKAERLAPDTAFEATLGKAKCRLRLGRYGEAGTPLRTGLRAALGAGSLPDVLFTAIAVADVALAVDQDDDAARALLKYAWEHPGRPAADYLAPQHEPQQFAPAQAIDRTLRLDEICELTLSTYRRISESTSHAYHAR